MNFSMRFPLALAAPVLWLATAVFCDPGFAATSSEKPLVAAYNRTGERIFQDIARSPGNIVLSPYSIGSALSMVLAGARGDTAKAIGGALGLTLTPADLATANAGLIADLKSASGKNGAVLNTANALVEVQPDIVAADYRALLRKDYAAETFSGDVGAINRWVAKKTSGKISHMLDALPGETGFVLVNAAYLKAFWRYPFDKAETENGAFHLTAATEAQVPMMHDEDQFAFVESKGFKAIRLPYRSADQRLGMIIVLPAAVDGLAAIVNGLGSDRLAGLFADLNAADFSDVQLQLPRFHAGYQASLAAPLRAAGMADAFDQHKADFRGMTNRPPDLQVAIGDVIHSAVIDVNEESSEAAAATAVPMAATAMAREYRPPPVPFIVDRPFLFFIVDRQTGAVLFQGRIADPRN